MRGPLATELNYRILIKIPDGMTHIIDCNGPKNHWTASAFYAKVDLTQIGSPAALGLSAEVSQKILLDRTAWHFWVTGLPIPPGAPPATKMPGP